MPYQTITNFEVLYKGQRAFVRRTFFVGEKEFAEIIVFPHRAENDSINVPREELRSMPTESSLELAQFGAIDGLADGGAGKDARDISDQPLDYQESYMENYHFAINKYNAEHAEDEKKEQQAAKDTTDGTTAGKADGEKGSDPADLTGKSAAYVTAYNKAYTTGKGVYDKAQADTKAGTEAGTTDGSNGSDKADLTGKSDAYTTAYNTAYTTGKAAYDAAHPAEGSGSETGTTPKP